MQTFITDKDKTLIPDTIEAEIDIDTIDDGSQELPFVVEQEELIVDEPHLEPTQIDQGGSRAV